MESLAIKVAEIYVPTKRRGTLDSDKVDLLAESILEEGQKIPIQVRRGNNRYVLIEGMHRLEAMKALGEESIEALIVAARRH
ncbi:MAG: ParB N-terminal domain-containing protein [Alphaproteobacteria bacterium]|jgi:ParB-like chromosome segregation protein Spo0J|nr:chromosome partitioning protein ParB [Rhodospirillaceae bacterium]MDP6020658.1 ParB N-terminal domain-containing protein [Alphaproteobacteria bacterium]MDP6256620.1 ParB N-terminal domain-containing protein [Alphaproteobacteria bacterium]MDP7054715.1 ParB N-terminal domain-containing protein [Alphaproteobacteria bacterium]MDP7229639.1 ParB N-terminal domain-containing protein [Alphaproteobacteria bacterium]|tara:strand:- start:2457 stop:2702 length:246 start_codon:yes stop_codon:yes gene_type:complete